MEIESYNKKINKEKSSIEIEKAQIKIKEDIKGKKLLQIS